MHATIAGARDHRVGHGQQLTVTSLDSALSSAPDR